MAYLYLLNTSSLFFLLSLTPSIYTITNSIITISSHSYHATLWLLCFTLLARIGLDWLISVWIRLIISALSFAPLDLLIYAAIYCWMAAMRLMNRWISVIAISRGYEGVTYRRDSGLCRGSGNRSWAGVQLVGIAVLKNILRIISLVKKSNAW